MSVDRRRLVGIDEDEILWGRYRCNHFPNFVGGTPHGGQHTGQYRHRSGDADVGHRHETELESCAIELVGLPMAGRRRSPSSGAYFHKRLIPNSFLGLAVGGSLSEPLPDEFDAFPGYIWAPENHANFVDGHVDEIRGALGNRDLTRDEMLSTSIGMLFEVWAEQCRKFGPGYTNL